MEQQLTISFDGKGASLSENRWVHLTQPIESGMDKTASMYDISQMVARARAGQSASTYKKNQCAVVVSSNSITITLEFSSWPSSIPLEYIVEASLGTLSPKIYSYEYTEFSIVFGKTDAVELDFVLHSTASFTWETSCWSVDGLLLKNQDVTLDGTTLRTEVPVFGVLRVIGRKLGFNHTVTCKLVPSIAEKPIAPDSNTTVQEFIDYFKPTDLGTWDGIPVNPDTTTNTSGYSITNLSVDITAKWLTAEGEEQKEVMRLNIPQCMKDLLSTCDGDLESFNNFEDTFDGESTHICDNPEGNLTVYVSDCSGRVLAERLTATDPDGWCA